jgi:AcrR family transcriptional regulator
MEDKNNSVKRGRGRPVNEARREEIIATAGQLFCELGLHATTMERIAKELKISKLTLYSRFADKAELFSAVIKTHCQSQISVETFGDFAGQTVAESLYQLAFALMGLLTSAGAMKMERMLMGTDFKEKKALSQLYYEAGPERVKSLVADYLGKLHTEQKLHVPNPALSANLFAAMIKGSDICLRALMEIPPDFSEQEKWQYCQTAVDSFMAAHALTET